MKEVLFILVASVILLSTTCHKQPCLNNYSFEIPFSITELDTFKIGDTIWLESNIKDKLMNKNSSTEIDVSKFDFKVYCGMSRVDTNIIDEAEKYFNFINKIGKFEITFLSSTINTKVIYAKLTNSRSLKIGLIPQKIGIFELGFYNLTDDLTNTHITQNDCNENINVNYNMNEGRDFNYYLIQKSPLPVVSEKEYKKDGAYAFKVIK